MAQALLGFTSKARWLRFLPVRMPGTFRYLPGQSGYNRRPRAASPLVKQVMRWLAADTDLWTDTTWIVDSTPVECGRSLPRYSWRSATTNPTCSPRAPDC